MATGGREDSHTCAVCLENHTDPKLLTCRHTFCAACIQSVVSRHSPRCFPCPVCGETTSLPAGGVASLPSNCRLQPQPAQPQSGAHVTCSTHPEERLRFYCAQCDQVICRDCKLTRHERHSTDDLASAAAKKKEELQSDQPRLQNAESAVKEAVKMLKEERQSLDTKRAAVEKSILNRHAVVVAAADRKRDEELGSLRSLHTDMDKNVGCALEQREGLLAELSSLLQQLDHAVDSGSHVEVLTVAKEMRNGCGSKEKLDALTSQEERSLQRPVLQSEVSSDVLTKTVCSFVGSVGEMEMAGSEPEVKVTDCFPCAEDPDVDVFSLCYRDGDPPKVFVSFDRGGMEENMPMKIFTVEGTCVEIKKGVGKRSWRRCAEGLCMYGTPDPGCSTTYCKSPSAAHFRLDNCLSGSADIKRVTVKSIDPLSTVEAKEFTIQVGPHRAFDVDDTEQYFAVVEEAKDSEPWRSVHLFQRSVSQWSVFQRSVKKRAVSTYSPPTEKYQPSDVCFYTLKGQKVLLITDELNDAIHVVTIQEDTMKFERYLCAGCPSLIQPTAITVDLAGRLWVASRGGAVLRIEQLQ